MEKRRNPQAGFTIVELAIVMAVAAILIAAIIYGAGSLSSGAKVNRMMEFTKALQTAAATCKTKNSQAFLNINKNTLDIMVRDSMCRTSNPNNRGMIPAGFLATLPPGLQNIELSYNTQTGGLNITYTIEDEATADELTESLKKLYPGAQRNGTQITFHMQL